MSSLDFIGAIERAYDHSTDRGTWLEDLTRLIAPSFCPGSAHTTAFFFDCGGESVQLGDFVSVGDVNYQRADYELQHEAGRSEGPPSIVYECDPFTLLSRVVGAEASARTIREAGMNAEDALGLRANLNPTSGVIWTTHVPAGFRIRNRELWTRFAAHAGAALRLREARGPDHAAAILTPHGRLEHGTDDTVEAREHLARAATDMDRARGKLRRVDPAEASALWRAMVQGEWTLVDWVDHDGKRFLLAHENRVVAPTARPLTRRERQVVACAAMGHANKLIAYDLGISPSTVAKLLTRAAKKLGVSGRVALIRAFRDLEAG